MSSSKPFHIALVGAGGIAATHAAAARSTDGRIAVSAVVDTSTQSRQAFADRHGVPGFASAETLFEAIDNGLPVDGVVLCTPPSFRLRLIEPAVARKIAVLVEKPLASSVEEARRLVDLAEQCRDTLLAVGYCHRFTPAIRKMRELVREGRIGRLTRFENVFAFHFPQMKERWMSDPAVSGGGSFIDTGCHSLDLFRYLVGPAAVVGAVYDHDWEGRGESSATTLVRATGGYAKGAAGVILAGWLEPARFQITLVGTGGLLSYDYDHAERLVLRTPDGASEDVTVETHEVRFARQLLRFAEAAASPSDAALREDLATFDDGLAATEAVDAASHASRII